MPKTCQFPLWPNGEKPDGTYCGEPVKSGSSYCPDHHKRCWRKHGEPYGARNPDDPVFVGKPTPTGGRKTERQIKTISRIKAGKTNREIADELDCRLDYVRRIRTQVEGKFTRKPRKS